MRKLNFEEPFSDEDIAWLRQAGSVMSEEQIAKHQSQFEAEVPEEEIPEDEVTRSALDPTARTAEYVPGDGAPVEVDPTEADPQDDEDEEDIEDIEGDDYETRSVADLEDEVDNRNKLEGSGPVEVVGTGRNGKVLKADLVKGLRLWDTEYPDALG